MITYFYVEGDEGAFKRFADAQSFFQNGDRHINPKCEPIVALSQGEDVVKLGVHDGMTLIFKTVANAAGLRWYEAHDSEGKSQVIIRACHRGMDLVEKLFERGALPRVDEGPEIHHIFKEIIEALRG